MRNIPIVKGQISAPPTSNRFIERSQLNKKFRDIPNNPLTLVYAGAGYGKSTALTLFAEKQKAVSWYSISQHDDDLLPFIVKTIYAIRHCHPEFGETLQKEIQHLDNYMTTEEIYSIATLFINEIAERQEKIILILDDFHHVMQVTDIENWLLYVLEYMPPNFHLIVASRRKPRWKILPKLMGQGDLLEITQYDLVLSPAEMSYILEEIYEMSLSDKEVANIYRLTEGWAIAFNMLAQQLVENTSITTLLSNQKKSLRDLFSYLATEVLSKQSLITQQFLMQSSILHVLTPETCDYVLDIQGSEEILTNLLEQNLFIEEGDGTYRYHALFQAFLENAMKEKYEVEWKALHKRAANYFERKGDSESALYHYQEINEEQAIAAILNKKGSSMLQAGRLQALYDLLNGLHDVYKVKYPRLYFYQGEIERYRSLYEEAEQSYDAMIAALEEGNEDTYLMSLALEGKAQIYLDTIQPDRAERFVNQALILREQANATKKEMAKIYILMAENLLNAGQAVKAEAWYDRAKRLNLPLEESNLQARIYLRTGRLQKAKEVLIEKKTKSRTQKHLPQSHRETDVILSLIAAFMGDAEESKRLATESIQLGLKTQSPFVEACGWMRLGHSAQLTNQYDQKLAIQCYETALNMMEKINVSRGKAEPYMGLSILYGHAKNYHLAIDHAERGLIETEKVKDRWLGALIKLGMVITEIYQSNYERASEILEQVRNDMRACGDRYALMLTHFWSAYIAFEQQDTDTFKMEMTEFLQVVQLEGYEFFLKKRTSFGPLDMQNIAPMLLEARKLKVETAFVSRMLTELGVDHAIKNHPGYTLVIHTLGNLRLTLGTKEIAPQDWQRGKAKELFELLITHRHMKLQKEEIFQYLWPDQEEETANKNFKVTLNALLKVLEPHRKAREESFFVLREGSAYGLNPNAAYEMDSMIFENLISKGLEETNPRHAAEILEEGLNLYKGDYLNDLRLKPWTNSERERLRQLFLRGAERLAQHAIRLLEFNLALEWCERILAVDPTWEEAYRLLMYCYYQNNNRPQAIRWYEKCCEVLEDELGVEPMEQTREMYKLVLDAEELDVY